MNQTTLTNAITKDQTIFDIVSATGVLVGGSLYVIDECETIGEYMPITALSSLTVTVQRFGENGSNKRPHRAGATVIYGANNEFQLFNPSGAAGSDVVSNCDSNVNPWINIKTGEQWLPSTISGGLVWVPGWNNPSRTIGVTAAVASAAGAITPSGPFFHVTGALAITGFTIPVGFSGGSFTIIPDGAFTWTTAGNIALAGTAVVSRCLTFQYESGVNKFYPSYV